MQAATDTMRSRDTYVAHIREITGAVLLTAGYYASRVPALSELLGRVD